MTPALTFCIGIVLLVLFGWYFATDFGARKRLIATLADGPAGRLQHRDHLAAEKKIQLGLDIQGGTSFLIRLVQQQDKDVNQEQCSIRRSKSFASASIILAAANRSSVRSGPIGFWSRSRDWIRRKSQEARQQLSRVAKLEFRLVYPDNGQRLQAIDAGTEVIPPEYRIETLQDRARRAKKTD